MSRNTLKPAVQSQAGAFDLPSIIVAVITAAILTAGVLATIFGIIPFAQDNGAKQDVAAVRTAEAVARTKDGRFMNVSELISAGYLPEKTVSAEGPQSAYGPHFDRVASSGIMKAVAGVNAKGDCYLALGKSGTGKIFYGSDTVAEPQALTPSDNPGCLSPDELNALIGSIGGFEGSYAPLQPAVTGTNSDETHAVFTWDATENADNYRVESRINGRAWTLITDDQTETTATVTANPSDVIDLRVTARNRGGDSGYGTATVKLPDPLVANGGFENGLTSWTPAGTAEATSVARTGLGAAKLTAKAITSSISQAVAVPADRFSTLEFWYTANNRPYSRTEVQIRSAADALLATPFSINNGSSSSSVTAWTKANIDMTDYKGQTVTLVFTQSDVGHGPSTSSFDDVALTSTPPVITDAPTRVGATADDTAASLVWDAPSSRAAAITEYTVTPYLDGSAQAPVKVSGNPAATEVTVTGLTPGASYTFTVTATNSAGTSPESERSAAVVPGPVRIANAGFEADLKFWTAAGTAQPTTTARTGFGAATLIARSGTSTLSQSVNVPAEMFSTLEFWYRADNHSTTSAYSRGELQIRNAAGTTLATPVTVSGDVAGWTKATADLTDFKGQTVTLTLSQYDMGYGSTATTFTVDDLALTSTPPVITAAPTRVGATADETAATVAWDAPVSRATVITGYTVTPYLDGNAQTPVKVAGTVTTATVTGLVQGGTYTFTVTATNSAGTSPESARSAAVTPVAVPIRNAGFEADLKFWTAAGTAQPTTTARTGFGAATLIARSGTSTLSQPVNVPAEMFSTLEFWYRTDNHSTIASHSRGELQIRNAAGTTLATPVTVSGDVAGWTKATADLTDFKGQTVTLTLSQYDAGYGSTATTFTVDDLALTSTRPVITDAPTRVGATADDTTASLTWVAPASRATNITAYTITPYLNGAAQAPVTVTGDWAPTSATLTGLTNGASYTFTVTATNSAGTSAPSAASAGVVPGPVKIANAGFEANLKSWTAAGTAQPTTTARTGFGAATLIARSGTSTLSQSVNVPAEMFSTLEFWYRADNYSTISAYSRGELQIRNAAGTTLATPVTVSGDVAGWTKATADLTDFKGQTVTLTLSQYDMGYGSTATTFTVDDLALTSTPPVITAAPTRVGATADDTTASLAWVAPASRAAAITSFVVTPHLNGVAQAATTVTGSPAPTTATLTGLTNGASYTFTVAAANSAGTSPDSAPSAAVVPGPVKIANAGFEAGLKSWTAAGTASPSASTRTGFGSASLISTNAVRDSSISQSVNIPADMFSNVEFYYLANNNHAAYNRTELQVLSTTGAVLATPFTVSGDTNSWTKASVDLTDYQGQTVVLKINQHNNGYSTQGVSTVDDLVFTSTPPAITAAPTSVGATADDTTASLAWVAPSSRATPVTSYAITPYLNGEAHAPVTVTGSPAPTTANLTGLINGGSYTFTVAATNSAGTSSASASTAPVVPGPVVLANAGFEAGLKSWTTAGTTQPSASTRTGFGSATLSSTSAVRDSSISQSVNIPAGMFSTLDFWYTTSNSHPSYNRTELQILSTAGVLLATPFTNSGDSAAWKNGSIDLTDYQGQTVVLKFNQHNNGYSTAGASSFDDLVFTSTPATISAAPTSVVATGGNTGAAVSWAAPSSKASPITSYTVTPYLDGVALEPTIVSGNQAAAAAWVSGLTNGLAYTFTVTATNGIGTSEASAMSAPATPAPELVLNGGFEAGLSQWATGGNAPRIAGVARTGASAVLIGGTNVAQSSISQSVVVPAAGTPKLTYWLKPASSEGGCNYDSFNVEARTVPGTAGPVLKSTALCSSTGTAWMSATVDLTAYKGKTIVLWFNVRNDGSNPSSVQLDDVSIPG